VIRKAKDDDLSRIAEIFIFNNRINYLPIFNDYDFSFNVLTVTNVIKKIKNENILSHLYVYEVDGLILGFTQVDGVEINKLYVDPFFQGKKIGKKLIEYDIENFNSKFLWVLEKNIRARKFYNRHGFIENGEKKLEDGTTEYLYKLVRK